MFVKASNLTSHRRLLLPLIALALIAVGVGCAQSPIDYSAAKDILEPYRGAVTEIVGLLDQGKGGDALALLDELSAAASQAQAYLTGTRFIGSADRLTDPFTLPAGPYRVHVVTAGYFSAKAVSVSDPSDYDRLFNLFAGEATEGASALYVADGTSIMVEISNVSESYQLWFERID